MPCQICGVEHGLEGHHVIPREYGGEKGPVVDLCGSCHNSVHHTAEAWLAGKHTEYFPEHLQQKSLPYIQAVMASAVRFEELGGKVLNTPPKILSVRIKDPKILVALHKLKADHGYTNMEKFLNDVFTRMTEKVRIR